MINFYLADNENEVKAHVNTILEDIRKENGDDETIYLKTLNITPQKFNSIHNLYNKKQPILNKIKWAKQKKKQQIF